MVKQGSYKSETTIQALEGRKLELEVTIKNATFELNSIKKAINALTGHHAKINNWTQDALSCITQFNRPVTTLEILNCLFHDKMQELADETAKRNKMIALSVALGNMCNNGTLKKFLLKSKRSYYYGLPAWFNDKDELKPFYRGTLQKWLMNKELQTIE